VEYINKVRINAACKMLLCGKMPVTEVAFSCGYGNLSNFNRQFRRITGRSPREYRESQQ
jgi:AraC-like DNA-binding protein